MSRQLLALLWKEWREQWPVLVLLWALLPAAAFLVCVHYGARTVWELFGMVFLSLGAATIGGRLFAPEGEAGTLGFLLRQPVRPAGVWGAKLVFGAASLGRSTSSGPCGAWPSRHLGLALLARSDGPFRWWRSPGR